MAPASGWDQRRAEVVQHLFVDGTLEGHDQGHQLAGLGPAPGVEIDALAGWPGDVDFAVLAGEAHQEPLLALATIAPTPGPRSQRLGQVVAVPGGAFGDDADGANAGFLCQLAQGSRLRVFVGIDAALRHLPPGARPFRLVRSIEPAADPNQA